MEMWPATTLSPELRVDVVDRPVCRDEAALALVDRLWGEARLARPDLFNGRVFSAVHVSSGCIVGHWTEYRFGFAQLREPALFGSLGVRPVAVCGVVRCPDGIVFGRRSAHAVYQAGQWQCPPAGSIERRAGDGGRVDLRAQLLSELEEELGLAPTDVTGIRPLSAVEHPGSHVVDIGMAIETARSGSSIVQAQRTARGRAEYEEIEVVSFGRLDAQIEEWAEKLVPPARSFLAALLSV